MSICLCFFNGTPIQVPIEAYKPLEKGFMVLNDEQYEEYFEQMTLFETTLCKHSIGGVVKERSYDKASKELGLDKARFCSYWIIWVYGLIKGGRIKEDNENGFMFIHGDVEELKHDNCEMLCGLCRAPSKLKCGKCGQRYCCKEHQVSDWKKHKKECYGCLSPEEWKATMGKRLATPHRS
jgi:hypothetical protein